MQACAQHTAHGALHKGCTSCSMLPSEGSNTHTPDNWSTDNMHARVGSGATQCLCLVTPTHLHTPLMRQQHKSRDAARSTHIHTDSDAAQPGITHKAQDSRKLCKHQHFYCCTAHHTQQSGLQPKVRLCLVQQGSCTAGLSVHADSCSTSQWQACRSSAGQAKHSKLVVRKKTASLVKESSYSGSLKQSSSTARALRQLAGPTTSSCHPAQLSCAAEPCSRLKIQSTLCDACLHVRMHTHGTAARMGPPRLWGAATPLLPAA
jgi:hypothetical protein